jgi:hypothetical protein
MENYKKCVRLVNGVSPDEEGNVVVKGGLPALLDNQLDNNSQNPVENRVITEKFYDVESTFTESLAAVEEKIPTDSHIAELIDAKLGVIENGTY